MDEVLLAVSMQVCLLDWSTEDGTQHYGKGCHFSSLVTSLFQKGHLKLSYKQWFAQSMCCCRFSGDRFCRTHFLTMETFPILFNFPLHSLAIVARFAVTETEKGLLDRMYIYKFFATNLQTFCFINLQLHIILFWLDYVGEIM